MIEFARPLIYFVEHNGLELTGLPFTVLSRLSINGAVIIWKNQGAFRLVPHAIIYNNWAATQLAVKQREFFPRSEKIAAPVNWSQGFDISPDVVKVLQSETFADQILNALKEHLPLQ